MNKLLIIILFSVFCISLSVNVLVTDPFFTKVLLASTSPSEAKLHTEKLWNFFKFSSPVPDIFSADEKSHLVDVRRLLVANFLLCIFLAVFLWGKINSEIAKKGFFTLSGIAAISILIPFEKLFMLFHYVFFPQGNFMFASESALITFYPADFFMYYSIGIAVFAFIISGTICFLTSNWKI